MVLKRRAVITGLGIVSPIGTGIDAFWQSALNGRSGIGTITQFDTSRLPPDHRIAGEVHDFDATDWMGGMFGRMAGRFSHFAVAASRMAYRDARLDEWHLEPHSMRVAMGSTMSGLVHTHEPVFSAFLRGDRVVPWTILEYPVHAATSHVTAEVGALGHTASFATGCCAGIDAIAWATEQVQHRNAAVAIAGGVDTPLSEFSLKAFHASGALSRWDGPIAKASRPFDKLRSGFVLGEGAAAVVIEDENLALQRGARIYAHIAGFGSSSEGGELRTVDEEGKAAACAMSAAIADAGLSPSQIDYVCAHGNSMVNYDAAETAALKLTLGSHAWNVPISSIKSMCGHALGAAGPMQLVTACLAIRDGIVPPTINYEHPDPVCDLDYVPNLARRVRVRNVLMHVHSIGGTHMALTVSDAR